MSAHYAHTNLVARDLDRLIGFYRAVFSYQPAGHVTWTYVRDPEGTILELQPIDPVPT